MLQDFFRFRYRIGDVAIAIRSTDSALEEALRLVFGRPDDSSAPLQLGVSVTLTGDEGVVRFDDRGAEAIGAADLLLGVDAPDFPFRLCGSDAVPAFAWRNDSEPLFTFASGQCLIRLRQGWRLALALLILHRVYAIHRDAIFFHAATVGIGGNGFMIIGAKGGGKSTTAMALTARGHSLLGDETACYLPASHEVIPFRRPVGIKPGPRSHAITAALGSRTIEGDALRIDFDEIVTSPSPQRVPLCAILFLEPFAGAPCLIERPATTAHLARLQPVATSLVNVPRTRRVFELGRMLSSSRIFELTPADPDETAALIEHQFLGGCS